MILFDSYLMHSLYNMSQRAMCHSFKTNLFGIFRLLARLAPTRCFIERSSPKSLFPLGVHSPAEFIPLPLEYPRNAHFGRVETFLVSRNFQPWETYSRLAHSYILSIWGLALEVCYMVLSTTSG